jgi:hypothetical protein
MDTGNSLISGLDAFAEQFRRRPTRPGFRHPSTRSTSVWPWGLQAVWAGEPYDLAIEVKYLRSHPSGSQPARPVHYGQLLADFNKITQVPARLRLVVLAADDGYVRYIGQSGRSVLPLKAGEKALVTPSSLGRLADTPRQNAESHGPWRDLRTTLRWTSTIRGCSLLAWEVTPETGRHRRLLANTARTA